MEYREKRPDEGKSTRDFLEFMACGAFSKTIGKITNSQKKLQNIK
jgi:hypothetical protein